MECTVDIYTDYLISSTGQVSATGLSRLYDGAISHDQVTRMLTNEYLDSTDLWGKAKPLIRKAEQAQKDQEFAVLIVDDTIIEKLYTDESALITTYWDHSHKRYVKGVNLLSLFYQLNELALPISAQLIEKSQPQLDKKTQKTKFKSEYTKNEYLQQMLKIAQQQVDYKYLLADSWYASKENMNYVLGLKHHFIFALESSRTVALSEKDRSQGKFQRVDALVLPDRTPLKVFLRSVKQELLLVRQVFTNKDGSEGCLYLITSDTTLDYEQVTTIYQRRWKVEEYHKSLKQNTSIGKSPTKTPDTQSNHFFASMLAYIKLEALKLKLSIGHFRIKAQLYLAGLKAMHQELSKLAA
jgi:hypothetical protein